MAKKKKEELSEDEQRERKKRYDEAIKTILECPATIGAQFKINKGDTLSQDIADLIKTHAAKFKGGESVINKKMDLLKYVSFGNTVKNSAIKAGIGRQLHYRWIKEDAEYSAAYDIVSLGSREDDIQAAEARISHSVTMLYNAGVEFMKMYDPEIALKFIAKATDNDFKRLHYYLQEREIRAIEEQQKAGVPILRIEHVDKSKSIAPDDWQ